MKKTFSVFLTLVLLICVSSFAAGADFRNVRWGMSKEEVMASEEATPSKMLFAKNPPSDVLYYDTKVLDHKALLTYNFGTKGLVAARYGFMDIKPQEEYALYCVLKKNLVDKYGAAIEDKENWANETYKSLPASMDIHVERGHVSFLTAWVSNQTVIILECKQEKSLGILIPNTTIKYFDKDYYLSLQQPKSDLDSKNL